MALVFSVWMAGGAAAVFAAEPESYGIKVGCVEITSENKDDITKAINEDTIYEGSATGTATFEPSEDEGVLGTLKLDGFTYNGKVECGIYTYLHDALTIELSGSNSITLDAQEGLYNECICIYGELIISGEGSLDLGFSEIQDGHHYCIDAPSLEIKSGVTVTADTGDADGGSAVGVSTQPYASGIDSYLTVDSGATLNVKAGTSGDGNSVACSIYNTMTVKGTVNLSADVAYDESYGIGVYSDEEFEDGDGILIIDGGTLNVSGADYGISANEVTIKNGAEVKTEATGGEDIAICFGLCSPFLNVSDSTLEASAGEAYTFSWAISADEIVFNESTVTAKGADGSTYLGAGIMGLAYSETSESEAESSLTISGGSVTASGSATGIYGFNVTIEDATVESAATATGLTGGDTIGLVAESDLIISNSTVTAKAEGYGMLAEGDLTIENSVVTSESTGEVKVEEDGYDFIGIVVGKDLTVSGENTIVTAKGAFSAIMAGADDKAEETGVITIELPLGIETPEDGYLGNIVDGVADEDDLRSVLTGEGEDAEHATEVVIKVQTVTLTIDPGDGSEPVKKEVPLGSKPEKPTDPTKAGYEFDGWYEDPEFEKEFNFDEELKENKTMYAKWTKITYEGDPVTYKQGSGKDAEATINRDPDNASCFSHFTGKATLGNKELKKDEDYTASSGSTIIKLSAKMLDTLEAGTYTLTVEFDDGVAEIKFTIEKADPTPTPTTEPTATPTSTPTATPTTAPKMPKSGDTGSIYPVLGTMVVVVSTLAFAVLLRKRKQENMD